MLRPLRTVQSESQHFCVLCSPGNYQQLYAPLLLFHSFRRELQLQAMRSTSHTFVRRLSSLAGLEGRTAVVTGGVVGLGARWVRRLLEGGARVSFLDVNMMGGMEFERLLQKDFGDKVLFTGCDVRETADVQEALQRTADKFGGFDLLINNAGIGSLDLLDAEKTIDIDLTAVITTTKLALPYLQRGTGDFPGMWKGCVLNISSIAGLLNVPSLPVYCAAKAGVVHFTRSHALALKRRGIRMNVLCPGFTDTPLVRNGMLNPKMKKLVESMGPLMTDEEVAEAADELITFDNESTGVVKVVTKAFTQVLDDSDFYQFAM